MIVELPLRVPCHAVSHGYLTDPASGAAIKRLGRIVTRITKDFPRAALSAAVPRRIASHAGGLVLAIHPEHRERGALVVQPVYLDTGESGLRGQYVVALRIALFPQDDSDELPGDGARSCAWAFDWKTWQAQSAGLLQAIAMRLQAERVSAAESHADRINAPRPSIEIERRRGAVDDTNEAVVEALLDGLDCGTQVRLDRRSCPTEAAFLSAVASALARLPDDAAGHVSIATGLARLDPSIAWAWCNDLEGRALSAPLRPDLAGAGSARATAPTRRPIAGAALDTNRPLPNGPNCEVLTASLEDPSIGLLVRAALATGDDDPIGETPHAIGTRLAEWAQGRPFTSGTAARLLDLSAQFDGGAMQALLAASSRDPSARTTAAILSGIKLAAFSIDGLSLSARLHAAAAVGGAAPKRLSIVFDRLLDALASRVVESACPEPDLLNTIAADDDLTAVLAAGVERGFGRICDALLTAAAAARCGALDAGHERAAWWLCRFGPRDARASREWREAAIEPVSLAAMLARFARDGTAPMRPSGVTAIGERLIASGRWKTVRNILAELSRLVPEIPPDSPDAVSILAQRLRMAAELISAMECQAAAPSSETARPNPNCGRA